MTQTEKNGKKIGWQSKRDDQLREEFWLNKSRDIIDYNMIFICGTDHLDSFGKLLSDSGHKVKVLPKRFDITP